MTRGPDLRLAVRRGWLLLGCPGLGRVEVYRPGILRFDPEMPVDERARQVLRLTREHQPPAEQVEMMARHMRGER